MGLSKAVDLAAASQLQTLPTWQPEEAPASCFEYSAWGHLVDAAARCTPALSEVIQQFWGVPVRMALLSVSDQAHYYWRSEDYHVSQLSLQAGRSSEGAAMSSEQPLQALLRLSEATCSVLLARVLGCRESEKSVKLTASVGSGFDFRQLSPLEASILNEFSRDIFACFKAELMDKPEPGAAGAMVHLVWSMRMADAALPEAANVSLSGRSSPPALGAADARASGAARRSFKNALDVSLDASVDASEVGKIILSLPVEALRVSASYPGEAQERVPDAFFYHVETEARLFVGQTRMALSELNHLEPEDVVVLEQSDAHRLHLLDPTSGEALPFQANIRQREQISLSYTQQELAMMETQSQQSNAVRQTLWDNLMIDVSAEFAPVKLPLKQLKQMSEGLVVEMGDLLHNKVCLQVEGKTLAWGELIIVGDKFGIRISQVEPEPGEASMSLATKAPSPSMDAMTPLLSEYPADHPGQEARMSQGGEMASGPVDEEANLDNFLNEDFDETFGEEEDW